MTRLLIFAITMLLLSSICNGQGKSTFGATRAQDTSMTVAQVKFSAYGGSLDTMLMIILPNGDVKKVSKNQFAKIPGYGFTQSGNTFNVDTSIFFKQGGNDFGISLATIGSTTGSVEIIAHNDTRFLIENSAIKVNNVDSFVIYDGGALRAAHLISDGGVKFSSYPNAGILGTDANGELIDNSDAYLPVLNIESFGADTTNDATAAIQAAINYLCGVEETFNAGNVTLDSVRPPMSGTIYIPNGRYHLDRQVVKFVTHPTTGVKWVNSQLYIPLTSKFDSSVKAAPIQIKFQGQSIPNYAIDFLVPNFLGITRNEPILYSTINNDASYYPAIIRAVPGDTMTPFGIPVALNPTEWHIENMTFRAHHDTLTTGTQLSGVDFYNTANQSMRNFRIDCDVQNFSTIEPTIKTFGLRSAVVGTGSVQDFYMGAVSGAYWFGVIASEHARLSNIDMLCVKIPLEIGSANYNVNLDNCLIHGCPYKISTGEFVIHPTNTASTLYGNLRIEDNRTTPAGRWYLSAGKTDIIDSSNTLRGELFIENNVDGVPSPTSLRINGAKFLTVTTSPTGDSLLPVGMVTNYMGGFGINYVNRFMNGGIMTSASLVGGTSYMINSANRGNPFTNPAASWIGFITGSSGAPGSLFGKTIADNNFVLSTGSFNRGWYGGTLTSDTVGIGTNGVLRTIWTPSGTMFLSTTTLLGTPVANAIENDGTHLYYTAGSGTRYQLDQQFTFSTGLTNTAGTITNNVSTGVAGGQTITGGTGAGDKMTYKSTTGSGTATGIGHEFTGGTNGALSLMRVYNDGVISLGSTTNRNYQLNMFGSTFTYISMNTTASGVSSVDGFQIGFQDDGAHFVNRENTLIDFWVNNTVKMTLAAGGNLSLVNRIASYDGATPTDGQLLIGHTANGTFNKGTLTAGTGITITNGAGAVTITDNGNESVTTTSAGTFAPSASGHYVFTGTTSTWTLPAVSGTSGRVMFIKNRGSGTVTINTTAAANEIYSSSAVNTYALTAGSAIILVSDNTFYNIE